MELYLSGLRTVDQYSVATTDLLKDLTRYASDPQLLHSFQLTFLPDTVKNTLARYGHIVELTTDGGMVSAGFGDQHNQGRYNMPCQSPNNKSNAPRGQSAQ